MDEFNQSICVVQRRAGSDFFAGDECLENPFCLAAQGPFFQVVYDADVKIDSRLCAAFELSSLPTGLSFSLDDQQRVIHHSQF